MSELVLVRHGQATFGAASYDQLSDLGVEQVRLLAAHWRGTGEAFDCLYCGSLRRQRETARELLGLVRNDKASGREAAPQDSTAKASVPRQGTPEDTAPREDAGLNEYDGDPLIRSYLRDFARGEGFDPKPEWPVRDRALFQKLFEAAAAKWIADRLTAAAGEGNFERWPDFQLRVHRTLERIMSRHGGGSRVLIATSGGVIALALQRVLRFPDGAAIATNWMVHNSSVTRIKYGKGRTSLMQFNALPHLERPETQSMITYR